MTTLEYKRHLDGVIERIEKARLSVSDHHIVKMVAVSKYVDDAAIKALYAIGQRAFGENKVQSLQHKATALEALPLEWHFIGSLQKNKINGLIALNPALIHSIDSVELALALNERLSREGKNVSALIQINSAYESTKSGFLPEASLQAYAQIQEQCPHIHLKGVMSIGAHTDDRVLIQKSFERTRSLFEQLPKATICSMGMSGDFELAIACGSTLVRLGSILFPSL
jgi:hypothetical protein